MNLFDPLVWAALLMLLAFVLVILEVFIPSGGILGFLAVASAFGAVAMAFYHRGPMAGLSFVMIAIVTLPVAVALGFKYWPSTPIGRRVMLGVPTEEEILTEDPRKALLGKFGTAKTPMLLSGAIVIEGQTLDAVSQGVSIEPGERVVVLEVKSNRVVVRKVEDHEFQDKSGGADFLDRSIEELGLGGLEEPLS